MNPSDGPALIPLRPPAPAEFPSAASWLEVSTGRLRRNAEVFRKLSRESKHPFGIGAVLKANAYGHGLSQVLPALHDVVDAVYVVTPHDALEIRRAERDAGLPQRRVIVIGGVDAVEAAALSEAGVEVVLGDDGWRHTVEALRVLPLVAPVKVHVHVDSGLGREGFLPEEIDASLAFLRDAGGVLDVVGALSHFANTEDVTEQTYAREQLARFQDGVSRLEALLGREAGSLERHFAASAAALVLPEAHFDVVRVGIALYGLWPSAETRLSTRIVHAQPPTLEPVLSWRSRAQVVKTIPAGSFVGYGCTYRCPAPTRIAVLPVGYFDGYPRLVSGKAHVLVNGERAPVLGRVMMNHIVVDVTRAAREDQPITTTLLGTDGGESIHADTLAAWAQTINYEIVARLGPHLARIAVP